MNKYNLAKFPNGYSSFSTEKNPDDFPCWGVCNQAGNIVVEPEYDKGITYGTFNKEFAIFLSKYGDKKIYFPNRDRLIFPQYNLIGKSFQNIPELYSKNIGSIYYINKNDKYCLVTEDLKVLYESPNPFPSVCIFDAEENTYAVIKKKLIDLNDNQWEDGMDGGENAIFGFSINGKIFLIKYDNTYYVYDLQKRRAIVNIDYINKSAWAITPNAYYISTATTCTKYDDQGKVFEIYGERGLSGIMKLDDSTVIIGDVAKGVMINADTDEVAFPMFANRHIEGTYLLIINSKKGTRNGIADYKERDVVLPPIFTTISTLGFFSQLIFCMESYKWDARAKKLVNPKDGQKILQDIFTKNDWIES